MNGCYLEHVLGFFQVHRKNPTPQKICYNMFEYFQELYSTSNGNRSDVKDVCILFTDGRSNKDEHLTIPYAETLKEKG